MRLCDITGRIEFETDKAIRFNDGTRVVWLPKSQVEVPEHNQGDVVEITLPEWLAKEKELI